MPSVRLLDIIDILIVTVLIYQLLLLIRGTRAVQLVTGVVILILAYAISRAVGLYTLQFVLQYLSVVIPIALLVIFQPELRRMLEQLGRGGVLMSGFAPHALGREEIIRLVNDVSRAARILGLRKIGALIVLERRTGLADFIETGIKVDAVVTVQLLISLFFPNSPLHDGAAIIRGNRVIAAGCLLPLSENPAVSRTLGTRHRAGLGIAEQTDAVAIIVSEETGTVTLAREGELIRGMSEEELKAALLELCAAEPPAPAPWRWWRTFRRA
ncbi:MAG: TIGR00159 family protein [Bacillati bacterium ANGP1]|uniref:Diadenylate cyclase n=1 Tax=Candidatus Segetimicrobium genomatis TaxID=2569760 RepID=A0A537IYL2_9BACT|nr:MAG: TIGR00159 family protein [Terrabacteria group bacterium ANGP1]